MKQKQPDLTPKQARAQTVKDLTKKVKSAKTLAFADYHGLTVNQLTDLRAKIKEAGGEFLVAKNTLLSRTLKDSSLATHDSSPLNGPTVAIFSYEDEVAPFKIIDDSIKNTGLPKFKFGFLGTQLLDASTLADLAKIPGREVLHAKIVTAISSPIYSLVTVLCANIRNLVYILNQISNIKNQNEK